jgi:hypothetical protein
MKPEVMKAIPRSSVIKRIVIYVGIGLLLSWARQVIRATCDHQVPFGR